MKRVLITCDVKGCGQEAAHSVECCVGWIIDDESRRTYKAFENPLPPEKADLCYTHYQQWAKLTCTLLKMHKEDRGK